ncbi:MAG: hypothetical protein O3B35_05775 [Proteobacteria bacterium]|nr:hypothetical protein [Bacteroidota bacterium]MDA0900521.1 hypothetical protein [Pseudomonadota bacterium]
MKNSFVIVILLFAFSIKAQTVIGSGGNGGNSSVSYTIGEAFISGGATASAQVTQGFQQPNLWGVKFNQQRYNALCQSSSTIAMGTYLLVLNGNNTDWFLPSKDDLAVIYANRSALSQYLQSGTYWSSTDNGNGAGAWCLNLTTGYSSTFLKNDTYHRTKPIKYF